MNRLIDFATAALFGLAISAPLVSVAVFGYDPTADARQSPAPRLSTLISTDPTVRNATIRRIATSSYVGLAAIRIRSAIDLDVFHAVDMMQVVSGQDGWLFYKDDFNNGKCRPQQIVVQALETVEAMRAVAEGAGKSLNFAVAPDKTSIYPEKLGKRGAAIAGCAVENARRWRAIAAQSGSSVIDHASALRPSAYNDKPLFFLTDTHWNARGTALATRQLAETLLGRTIGLPDAKKEKLAQTKTDLMTRMLRLDRRERAPQLDRTWLASVRQVAASGSDVSVVVHDSFYQAMEPQLAALFPAAKLLNINMTAPADIERALREAKSVLVSSVERAFFQRMTAEIYSWKGFVGIALLAANETAARRCIYTRAYATPSAIPDAAGSRLPPGQKLGDAALEVVLPETRQKPCLRISAPAGSGAGMLLYLPKTGGQTPEYSTGYSIPLAHRNEPRDTAVVLPMRFAGQAVRIGLGQAIANTADLVVETGLLTAD